jgi:hypothetical protein
MAIGRAMLMQAADHGAPVRAPAEAGPLVELAQT